MNLKLSSSADTIGLPRPSVGRSSADVVACRYGIVDARNADRIKETMSIPLLTQYRRNKILMTRPHSLTRMASLVVLIGLLACMSLYAQEQTVGLFVYDSSAHDGYNLFGSIRSNVTYLMDMYGRQVHSWQVDYPPGNSVYLLENGHLLRPSRPANGGGGLIQEIAWDGTILWEYTYFDSAVRQHHDIEPMPNGNVLLLAWEYKTLEEVIAAGRDTSQLDDSTLWPEHVVEVEPNGTTGGSIVWEWHLWDHLIQDYDPTKNNYGVVAEHAELVNINSVLTFEADWIHANAIEYNAELDQIVICSRNLSEFWVIDHSTSTTEAAGNTGGNSGMGGDILYRWGNPQNYDAGSEVDQRLFLQHDAQWIKPGCPGEGNFLVFNNGGKSRVYSTVDEIESPVDAEGYYPPPALGTPHDPTEASWVYIADPPDDFYSSFISGAQRLVNGNTLICAGVGGRFFEVTPTFEIVWEYISPATTTGPVSQGVVPGNNNVFRCNRYPADYPGLLGRDLTSGSTIETYPITISGTTEYPANPSEIDSQVVILSTIKSDSGFATTTAMIDIGAGYQAFQMYDDGLHMDGAADDSLFGALLGSLTSGEITYYIEATDDSLNLVTDPVNSPSVVYRFTVEPGGCQLRGDVAEPKDGMVLVNDIVMLVDYLFKGGTAPVCLDEGDCAIPLDENILVNDIVWLVDFLFKGGTAPPDC